MNERILYILNINNNCSNILNDLEDNIYFSETLNMLICFSNNFYNINYTFIYFYNFSNEVGENLNNLIDEIINILNSKRLDENFINKF